MFKQWFRVALGLSVSICVMGPLAASAEDNSWQCSATKSAWADSS